MAGTALLLMALAVNRCTQKPRAPLHSTAETAQGAATPTRETAADIESTSFAPLNMLDDLAAEMISRDVPARSSKQAPKPSPLTSDVSMTTSTPSDTRISDAVRPYIHPDSMISAPSNAEHHPVEDMAEPAGVTTSASELIAHAYINKTLMVSEPPEDFSQAWIAYDTRKERKESAISDAARIPASHIGPANPEDITRAMFFVREAEAQRREGHIDGAIQLYLQALDRFPRMSLANREAGRLFLMKGRYNEAITHLAAALSGNEQLGDIYCDLGAAYLYSGQPGQALESFVAGLKTEPGNSELQFNQGLALRQLNRLDDARLILETYIQTHPNDSRGYRELAIVHLAETNTATALMLLEKAVELDPGWYTPMMDIALVRAKRGEPLDALRYLEMMIGKAPAALLARIYQQPAFAELRLMPESREFESRLADQYRRGR